MNYFLTRKSCYELNTKTKILPNVWYNILGEFCPTVFLFDNALPVACDFFKIAAGEQNCNVTFFSFKSNNYFMLCPKIATDVSSGYIKYQNKNMFVMVAEKLIINMDGKTLVNMPVTEIEYSEYQIFENHLILYFEGKRKFVVIIKDNQLKCAEYYEEINYNEKEIYFLTNMFDCLNHGRVNCIKDSIFSSYTVYLNNCNFEIKQDFLPNIFLDCVKAKNYKYAQNLLCQNLQPKQAEDIGKFFPTYNDFLVADCGYILLKNDTYLGVVKFEIDKNKITNITIF